MKKLLALLLVIIMLFSFSGCSNKDEKTSYWTEDGKLKITESLVKEIINGEFKKPKNVILIIGDGMGPNDLKVTEKYSQDMFSFGLVLNQIKNQGFAQTRSADSVVTDSAASATALSTGFKTNNGYLGVDPEGKKLVTMAEFARELGKKVGIITNEDIYGATPSGFTVHNFSRNNSAEIINSFIRFKPDVLMGNYNANFYTFIGSEERSMLQKDYIFEPEFDNFETSAETDADKPFLGFIEKYAYLPSYNLAKSAEFAFERLKNDNGFFVMIESAGTDKFGHNNDMTGKIASVVTLDRTVAAALLFMKENPDTLLIVTADHETGGVLEPSDEEHMNNLFTSINHTEADVKVFAVGKGSEYFNNKTVDNTDIAKFIKKAIKG